jgi:hypothetical protein
MTTSDIWVDTKTFYTRVDAQTDNNLIGRLKDMDEEISEFIYQNHGRTPDTKVTVTTAMGEGLYAVTVVITSPDYEEEYAEEEEEEEEEEERK